jgi:biotin synthase
MSQQSITTLIERIYQSPSPSLTDMEQVLSITTGDELQTLYAFADRVRKEEVGDGIFLRGIVEFSNKCTNTCFYCGLNKNNRTLPRYTLTTEEVLAAVAVIAEKKIRTVVLQSGEDHSVDPGWIEELVRAIKTRFSIAITLSVGEWDRTTYARWKEAGADRYLLKIETTDPAIYTPLHPGMSFENRMRCLLDLKELGYQTGSGIIIGLKGQTARTIAGDIAFFKTMDLDMIGIGPFIPHAQTELAHEPMGSVTMTLKAVALTRIVTRNAHLPATTSAADATGAHRLRAQARVLPSGEFPQHLRGRADGVVEKRRERSHVGAALGRRFGCRPGRAGAEGESTGYRCR